MIKEEKSIEEYLKRATKILLEQRPQRFRILDNIPTIGLNFKWK
jgi:hypothetical protein